VSERREEYTDTEYVAPRGELEARVARILAEILEVDLIGRNDSFYDFGGTSLQAIRFCARVEREMGCRALPVWLFEGDVLGSFVSRLTSDGAAPRE
jgi:hypothetical protein